MHPGKPSLHMTEGPLLLGLEAPEETFETPEQHTGGNGFTFCQQLNQIYQLQVHTHKQTNKKPQQQTNKKQHRQQNTNLPSFIHQICLKNVCFMPFQDSKLRTQRRTAVATRSVSLGCVVAAAVAFGLTHLLLYRIST